MTGAVRQNIERVIEGKPDVVDAAPGRAARRGPPADRGRPGRRQDPARKALARSIDCTVRRIQFTPDLLPSDVTGVSVFNQDTREFEFRPGGVFANIVVGDEINRASPKTQSALLEGMEERQVTVDSTTYMLEKPFMVIATQNPIEMEGTYALPEAQRDRFMARVSVGYPVEAAEIAMLERHTARNPLDDLEPVTDAGEIRKLIEIVGQVHVSAAVQRYAVALTTATRGQPRPPPRRLTPGDAAPGPRRQGRRGHARVATTSCPTTSTARPPGAGAPAAAQRRGHHERTHHRCDPHRDRGVGAGPRRRAVREALSALTVRGRAFLAAGVTTIAARSSWATPRSCGSASWSPRCHCSPPGGSGGRATAWRWSVRSRPSSSPPASPPRLSSPSPTRPAPPPAC